MIELVFALSMNAPVLVAVIGGAITLAAALGGIAGFHAYKSAAAGWREERDAAVAKAERLEDEFLWMGQKIARLSEEVESLRAKDTSKLYDLMVQGAVAVQERDDKLFETVSAIARAVVPDEKRR